MSEQSVAARKAMKAKVQRLLTESTGKVDASDWSPADTFQQKQTYLQAPARSKFKSGGCVEGSASAKRADRPGRAMGGVSSNPADPRNTALAMMQNAGNIGGVGASRMQFSPVTKAALSPLRGAKSGGKIERSGRKSGGRTKGKTNINIVIAQPPAGGQAGSGAPPGMMPKPPVIPQPGSMGPPLPQPGPQMGAPPMPPGAPGIPMPRKSGGRTMHAGAGSGLGRLEKAMHAADD